MNRGRIQAQGSGLHILNVQQPLTFVTVNLAIQQISKKFQKELLLAHTLFSVKMYP